MHSLKVNSPDLRGKVKEEANSQAKPGAKRRRYFTRLTAAKP